MNFLRFIIVPFNDACYLNCLSVRSLHTHSEQW